MRNLNTFVAASTISIILIACGENVRHVTESDLTGSIPVLEKGISLPECSQDNKGHMIFVEDSLGVFFCDSEHWLPVKGEQGINGADGKDGADGHDGESCSVTPIDNGFKVLCAGDSVGVLQNGTNGANGSSGTNGLDGSSCSVKESNDGFDVLCGDEKVGSLKNGLNGEKGETGAKGEQGEKGETGAKGEQGEKGDDGESCTVNTIENGFEVLCGGVSMGTLMNGSNGEKGDQGEKGDDCTLTDNGDGTITQSCGEESVILYKALCGTKPYDPAGTKFCYGVTLYEKCDGKAFDVRTEQCVDGTVTGL